MDLYFLYIDIYIYFFFSFYVYYFLVYCRTKHMLGGFGKKKGWSSMEVLFSKHRMDNLDGKKH